LETIFKNAREGNTAMTFGFLNSEKKKGANAVTDDDDNKNKSRDNDVVLYEQKKLEHIFREAREGGGGHGGVGNGSNGMTFGFQFGGGNAEKGSSSQNDNNASGAISFLFGAKKDEDHGQGEVNPNVSPLAKNIPKNEGMETGTSEDPQDMMIPPPAAAAAPLFEIKRRDGMHFPPGVLDELENAFFSLNDGHKILENIELMKNNEESQNAWNEERRILTADWKRKHKVATVAKQKKMKYQ